MFFTPWLRSFSRSLRSTKRRQKRLSPQQHHKMLHGPIVVGARAESLEERCVMTVGPGLVSVAPNVGAFLNNNDIRTDAPRELVFQFSPGHIINTNSLGGIEILRSGGDGIFGAGGTTADVAMPAAYVDQLSSAEPNKVVYRFASTLVDDSYRVVVHGAGPGPVLTSNLGTFGDGVDATLNFQLDLGAQVVSVVPQPVTRVAGALTQRLDQIQVYFNNDDLVDSLAVAENPAFYQLIDTKGTAATSDDTISLPMTVAYDAALDFATLTFATNLPSGTYKLKIGSSQEGDSTTATAVNLGTLFSGSGFATTAFTGDGGAGDLDLYRFNVASMGDLLVTVTPQAGSTHNTTIRLLNSAGASIATAPLTVAGSPDVLTFPALPAGTYFAEVSGIGGTTGSYRIDISTTAASPLTTDDNSSYATATDLGLLGVAGKTLSAAITPQPFAIPDLPGASDEPGHRDTPFEGSHGVGSLGTPTAPGAITVQTYNFAPNYGTLFGSPLINEITEGQKARVRELFELWSRDFGIQFVETASSGYHIIFGDPRAVDPTIPPVGGVSAGSTIIVNSAGLNSDESWGGAFMGVLMHEIGHSLGLGHTGELQSFMNGGGGGGGPNGETLYTEHDAVHLRNIYPYFATDIDLYKFNVTQTGLFSAGITAELRPTSSLLDSALTLFRDPFATTSSDFGSSGAATLTFTSDSAGIVGNDIQLLINKSPFLLANAGVPTVSVSGHIITVTLDTTTPTTAQQLVNALNNVNPINANNAAAAILINASFTGLGTTLVTGLSNGTTLALGGGNREVVASNDDYNSNDAFLSISLDPGTYYIGVSSTGNNSYNPTISDSGYGGKTDGAYDLQLSFTTPPPSTLTDADNVGDLSASSIAQLTSLDGDADGVAGGDFNFWFQSGTTIFVDKTTSTPLASQNGDILTPFSEIDLALTKAASRIVAPVNGAAGIVDGESFTITDNLTTRVFEFDFTPGVGGVSGTNVEINLDPLDSSSVVASKISDAINLQQLMGFLQTTASFTGDHVDVNPTNLVSLDVQNSQGLLTASSIVRIVGNGGTDGNLATEGDASPYLVGVDNAGGTLVDGRTFDVPQGTTIMIDAGAVIKLQNANIDIGTDPNVTGPNRQDGALQMLGTPKLAGTANNAVFMTSFHNDLIGGNSDGAGGLPAPGDWGGVIFRRDSDMNDSFAGDQDGGDFFLNSVYQADLSYGGGGAPSVFSTIHIVDERPAVAFSRITFSADAAISANPNSFDDSLNRIGPDIHGNTLINNSVNGVLIRINLAPNGQPVDKLDVRGRFNDTDLTHVISQPLQITGNAGGPFDSGSGPTARPGGRLQVDPGVVVKLRKSRIEGERGSSQLIAEGTASLPVIFTSLEDDRYGGASGTFDTSSNGAVAAAKGDWGGLFFGQGSRINVDQAYIAYGGGSVPIAGDDANFAAIEVHEADLRLTNTLFEFNANGADGSARNARTGNDASVVFVKGAQPIIINNTFHNNDGSVISIDANAMKAVNIKDTGRTTGAAEIYDQFADNQGPLVRLNRMANDIAGFSGVLGMEIRAAEITAESVWDDTDIVHVVESGIFTIDNIHSVGGLRLQSAADASLVVKLGAGAGFNIGDPDKNANNTIDKPTDDGPLEIDDRIGGTMQIIGAPGFPVIMTSIFDDSVGASLDTRGFPQTDTNGDGIDILNNATGARTPDGFDDNTDLAFTGTQPAAGNWGEILFNKYAHDRNVVVVNEIEKPLTSGIDTNSRLVSILDNSAEDLGNLAPNNKSSNENRRAGFEIHGYIAEDDPTDVDIYKFVADAGTEIWLDIDFVDPALDTIVEFVTSNGTYLARSQDNNALFSNGASAPAMTLQKSVNLGEDYYGTTIRDGGMRLVTSGMLGTTNTYFIRVRSNPAGDPDGAGPLTSNIEDLNGGLTSGQYQLQVRLGQRDETPGVAVKFADIRYATNGIHVKGLPYHSPLLGESTEFGTNDATNNTATPANALNLGNLLYSDRGVFSAGGSLSGATDIDFYRFSIDIAKIQEITGINGGPQTWATVIDLDWADGLTRPDTTIAIFRQDGQLVYIGRESNVADDQPSTVPGSGSDIDDLTRGSIGSLDPYIGTAMFEEDATNGSEFYYLAVVNNQMQPTALSANFLDTSGNATTTRLEPVTSVTRIAEDHIGFQGYTSNGTPVAPTTGPLIDISSSATLSTHVKPFSFQDVPLYVTGTVTINGLTRDQLFTVNPLTGNLTTRLDTNVDETDNGNQVQDLVMRSDGRLWAYRRSNTNNGVNTNNSTAGALVELESGITGTTQGNFISNVNDGIGSGSPAAGNFGNDVFEQVTNSDDVDALAFERNGTNNYNLYYSVRENGTSATTTGATTFNSKLYRANPTTGSAALGNPLGIQGDIQLAGTNPASGSLSFSSPNPSPTSFGNIVFQTRAQGTQANGVTLNITRTGGATQVNSASNGVINVQVNYDFTNNAGTTSIQSVVDVINASLGAQRIITAVATGTAGTLVTTNVSGVASGGTDDASGRRIQGNVTGLAFGSFTNGTLFGVTSGEGVAGRGSQLIRITPGYGGGGGTATIIRDFSASAIGTTATNGFQGLALGPQNVANDLGVDAFYANKLFAVTGDGRLVAMDALGNGVIAFDSNNEVQTVSVTGTPTAGSFFTLSFDSGSGPQTTDPIASNAPGAVSADETQAVDVVAYSGNYTLSFVNNLFDTTSPVNDILAGDPSFVVEDVTGLPLTPFIIRVENEEMLVTSRVGTTLNVTRGIHGTMAADHPLTATVFEVLTTNLNGGLTNATGTSLLTTIDNQATTVMFDVNDPTGFGATPFFIRIGAEQMRVTNVTGSTFTVIRGVNGTAIASHSAGATVTEILRTETILVDDVTSFPSAPFNIRVDNEDMQVTAVSPGQFTVTRGINGTAIGLHSDGATVYRLVTTAAGALQFNSTAAQIDTELTAALNAAGVVTAAGDILTTFGPTGATPTGFLATPVTVQFTGSLGRRDLFRLTGDTTNLVGDEQQSLTLNNTFNTNGSGTYTLTFGTSTTGPLNFNDSAAVVEAALDSLATIGGVGGDVTVSGTLPGAFVVTFGGTLQDLDVANLVVDNTQLLNNEIQRFQVNGAPTGGTFTLQLIDPANGYNPANIGPIAFNADQTAVQLAFDAALGAGVVTVSLSQPTLNTAGCVVSVTFDGLSVDDEDIANQMTVLTNALTGGTTPNVTLNTQVQGNLQLIRNTSRVGSFVATTVAAVSDGNLSVYDALVGLANLNPTDILVTGGDLPGAAVGVTFTNGADVNLMLADNFGMGGGSLAVVTTTGTIGDGLADNFIVSDATMSGATGLAFSPLDVNLWHTTTRRGQPDVAGHGINDPFDNSRHAAEEMQDIADEQGNTRTQTEGQGGTSFYFGLEQRRGGTEQYLNYESANGQLGVINDEWQRDLTTSTNSANIANTYNLPGGAFGRLTTNTIDLSAYVANDKPTMYFNYYLDTQNSAAAQGSTAMRDSARVFASRDGGLNWELIATNNTTLDAELAEYLSHSSSYFQSTLVQELFDTDQWRQARVDLSTFAGEATVSFRFDFATAGKIGEAIDPAAATLPGEEFGAFSAELGDDADESAQRATNNQFEGFYVDDIIVGFAERGELVTNAPLATTGFDNLYGGFAGGRANINNLSPAPTPITTGSYQFEVRRGTEYAAKSDPAKPRGDIAVNQTFDTNDSLIFSSVGQQPPLTENFDPDEFVTTPNFVPAAGSTADWFQTAVGSFPAGGSLPNAFRSGVIPAGQQSGVTLTIATGTGTISFLAAVDGANFTTGGFGLPDTTTINGLKFLIDGVEQQFVISGTAIPSIPGAGPANNFVLPATGTTTPAFVPLSFNITTGTHTFEWRYVKGTSAGTFRADAAFIDDLFIVLPENNPLLGDQNVDREQGMVVLEGNFIRNVSGTGIIVEPGNRDSGGANPTNLPYGGAVRQTPVLNNAQRLVTSAALINNVITNFGTAGIRFSGDNTAAADPLAAVPMGKLINNTIYGGGSLTGGTLISGTGIIVNNNASPTLINNIVANTTLGLNVDGTSGTTDISTTLFQNNTVNGTTTGNSAIINAGNTSPLFVNPSVGNFYLAAGITGNGNEAIDASLNQRFARLNYTQITNPLGIPPDPNPLDLIVPGQDQFAPNIDRYGQIRRDDPNTFNALGIFRDIGGIERADFAGPTANLTTPLDNGAEDLEPTILTVVSIDNPTLFTQFIVTLLDFDNTTGTNGIGVDDTLASLVTGSAFTITQTDISGTRVLVSGTDYTYAYNANTNEAIFTSLTVFPTEARYNIRVENNPLDPDAIFDLANNVLKANQGDGSTQFNILVTNGVNDPPIIALPLTPTTPEDIAITLSGANAIKITDADAFLNDGELQVVLTATNGTFSLNAAAIAALDFSYNDAFGMGIGDGTNDSLMRFRGTLVEIAAALDGLSFLPGPDVNDLLGTGIAPNDDIHLDISVNDLGNYWVNPVNGMLDSPQTDVDVLHFIVTPVNDEPVFTIDPTVAPPVFTVNEDETAANIAAFGQMLAINLGPGPVPTADDEYGQTLTFTLTPQTAGDATNAMAIFSTVPTLTVNTGTLSTSVGIGETTLTLSSAAQFTGLTVPFAIQIGSILGGNQETLTVNSVTGNDLNLAVGTTFAHAGVVGGFIGELVTHSGLAFALNLNANGVVNYNVVLQDPGLDAGTPAAGDNDNTSQTIPLTITVTAINDEPILTFGVAPTVNEDVAVQTVLGYVTFNDGDPEPGVAQTWTSATIVNAVSDRGWSGVATIFSSISINTATGDLSYTLMPDVNGVITVTVRATDSGLNAPPPNDNTADYQFTLNVNPVNDKPAMTITGLNSPFSWQPNAATAQAGVQTDPGFSTPDFAVGKNASAIDEVPPADPVTPQAVAAYTIVSGPDTIFGDLAFEPGFGPTIDPVTGNLTYRTSTSGAPTSGIAVVSVQMQDNGTTALGGVDLADPVDYYVAVGVPVLPTVYNLGADNVTLVVNPQGAGTADDLLEIYNSVTYVGVGGPGLLQSYNLASLAGGLLVRGNSNANSVTFDYANGAPIPDPTTPGVILSGGLGTDAISLVNGAVTSVVDTFSKADQGVISVNIGGDTRVINYIQFETPIVDSLTTLNRTFNFSGVNDDITLADPVAAGVSTIGSSLVGSPATSTSLGVTFTTGAGATITVNAGTGNDILRVNGYDATITTTSFNGNGGNDLLIGGAAGNNFSITAADAGTLNGAGRAFAEFESLQGGAGADSFTFASTAGTISGTIDGQGGNNTLDYLAFGAGSPVTVNLITGVATNVFAVAPGGVSNFSTLIGGAGADTFIGNAALANSLVGNGGADTLTGGSQNDTVSGDAGADSISSAAGDDSVTGGDGNDTIDAGDGNDTVTGGNNDDSIIGGIGNDSLAGNDGNDFLNGGVGNDTITGDNNDDTLVDGFGDDNLNGGTGNDTYVLTPGSADVLTDGGGATDVLDFSGASAGVTINLDSAAVQTVFGLHTVQLVGTFENFIGSGFDDTVTVTSNAVVRNVNGGVGNDKLIGPDFANTWNITGANSGTITGFMTFSNVENLTGGTQADTFAFADGLFGVSGVIDAGGGNDTLSYAAYTAPIGGAVAVVLSAAGAGTATRTGGIISFETVLGGAGDDTLTGSTNADSLVGNDGNDLISGGDGNDTLLGGLGGDTLSDGLGNDSLDGASGDDRYVLTPTGSDTVNDSSGSDTVDFSNSTSAIGSSVTPFDLDNVLTTQPVFSGASVRLVGGAFEGFIGSTLNDTVKATVIGAARTINGNGGTDTLLAGDTAKNWHITALNGGDIGNPGSFAFSSVENLVGGTSVDSFQFSGSGQLAGTINGGAGSDVLDYSPLISAVFVNLGTSAASLIFGGNTNGFSGIESFIGSSAAGFDTLTGPNTVRKWDITSANSGSIDSIPSSPAALVSFSSFENLTGGTSTDTFVLANGVGVSGTVNGGTGVGVTDTLSYAGYNTPVSVNLTTNTATNLGNQTNFESFIGGSAGDTFTGPTAANTWNISSASTGTITNPSTTLSFSSFETLGGGNSSDNFIFAAGSSIGGLNGGQGNDTLDLSNLGAVRSVTLTAADVLGFSGNDAAVTSGFTGINTIVATALVPDTLTSVIAAPTTWNLGSTNSLVVNGQTLNFSLFDNYTGGNGGNTFNINGPVTGNLVGGSGDDVFNFNAGGSLTGSIAGNGGNDTLGFPGISSALTITLLSADGSGYSGTNSLISGGFSGINTLAGGNGADTLIGLNAPATWTIGAIMSYTSGGNTLVFSSLENLNGGNNADIYNISGTQNVNLDGGAGDDTFNFADGASINGVLTGGAHNIGDTVSYAGNTSPVTVNLNNLNSVETVIGGNGSDTLIGLNSGSTFTISGFNSGTAGSIVFQSFENLTGSGNADTFNMTDSGTLTGVIDGGLGVDTLSFAAVTTPRIVTLTGLGAGDGFNGIEASVTGGFQNINTIIGSSTASDQLFGLDVAPGNVATWAINSTMTYSALGRMLNFSAFETMIGGTGNDEFTVTGARTGNLHGGAGAGLDSYTFAAGATLTGNINGDAGNDSLSFVPYTSAVNVTLTENLGDGYGGLASPILGGSFHNIDTLVGGNASDSLTGMNDVAAWEVDGTNRYSTSGSTIDEGHFLDFRSFENLNGGALDDTFRIIGAPQTVNLNGNDGNDQFILIGNGSVNGTIDGGNDFDSYDLSGKTTAQTISINNLISIENVIGTSLFDTLLGLNTATTFVIDGPNSGLAGTIGFSGFENLQGGTAGDSFEFLDGGSISGTVNGGTGSDALRFTDMSSSQAITLTGLGINDGFAGSVGATVINFTNIDSVVGTNLGTDDSVRGMNVTSTWTASGAGMNYTASSRTINLSNVESLLGGTGVDTFTFNATSTVTSVDAGDNADTINASAATINMTLFGGTGNDTILGGLSDDNIDGGLGTDELRQTTDNDQTLTDSSATGMGGDTLASIERAVLTGGGSGNSIDASGFSMATTLNGLGGNDTIFGGTGTDSINGGDGTDSLSGGDGNDLVDGGNGDGDSVSGGNGNDTLIGGSGINDVVVEVGFTGNVTLTVSALTGSLGSDTISGFEGASLAADSDNNVINASTFTGSATLDGGGGNDTIIGGTGNDYLIGGDDNDSLNGKSGNDTLDGAAGDDTLTGDLGNDQIDGGSDSDVLSETGNVNLTLTNTSLVGLGTDSLSNIESAILTGGISNNTFNATGFSLGSVTLLGAAGNDSLIGGSQNDSIDGGAGLDTLRGNAGNDTIRGSDGNDSLDGGDGNDDLNGQLGDDTVLGGNANDTITGDLGNDSLDGGLGTDRMVETGNVNFALTASQLTGVGTDKVLNFELVVLTGGVGNNVINATGFTGSVSLVGGSGNDTLTGGSNNDTLEGGDGNDQLTGALGNDSIDGGNGTDTLVETGVTNVTLTNTTLAGFGSDVLVVIESARLTSGAASSSINASAFTAGPVSLTGGAGNDSLLGGTGNDLINGGTAGKDTIRGGDGNDTLNGGAGGTTVGTIPSNAAANRDDVIHGDAGNDSILGQGGNDFLFGEAGNDTIDGGDGHDVIDGGDDNDSILGGLGNDAIRGGAGNDTLNGGDGNDSILGGTGADNILGGNGNDVLRGEDGNDTLSGQTGTDKLDGGAGTNSYVSPIGDLQGDFSAIFSDASFNALIAGIP